MCIGPVRTNFPTLRQTLCPIRYFAVQTYPGPRETASRCLCSVRHRVQRNRSTSQNPMCPFGGSRNLWPTQRSGGGTDSCKGRCILYLHIVVIIWLVTHQARPTPLRLLSGSQWLLTVEDASMRHVRQAFDYVKAAFESRRAVTAVSYDEAAGRATLSWGKACKYNSSVKWLEAALCEYDGVWNLKLADPLEVVAEPPLQAEVEQGAVEQGPPLKRIRRRVSGKSPPLPQPPADKQTDLQAVQAALAKLPEMSETAASTILNLIRDEASCTIQPVRRRVELPMQPLARPGSRPSPCPPKSRRPALDRVCLFVSALLRCQLCRSAFGSGFPDVRTSRLAFGSARHLFGPRLAFPGRPCV